MYNEKHTAMPNKKDESRGRSQDRRKVAGGQEHEVNYEKEKTGTSKEDVKESIKEVGNERKKVEEDLKKKKK
jgi:hypothetical protein